MSADHDAIRARLAAAKAIPINDAHDMLNEAEMELLVHAPTDLAALLDENERLRKYAPSPAMEKLLGRSSLGTDEAEVARASVSPDAGRALVRLSQVMAERDQARADLAAARERIAAVEALADKPMTHGDTSTEGGWRWVDADDLRAALDGKGDEGSWSTAECPEHGDHCPGAGCCCRDRHPALDGDHHA